MKLNYLLFRNPHFASGLKKLTSYERFNDNTKYRLMKMVEWIDKEEAKAQNAWQVLLLKYCEKDEKGRIKSPEDSPNSFRIPEENREAFEKDGLAWSETTSELEGVWPLDRSEVQRVGLNVLEEKSLAGMVEPISDPTQQPLPLESQGH